MSTSTCQNCGTTLQGPFCHACGQRDVDLRTSFFALFSEWGSNMVRLDGRLLRTLPGFLLHPHRLAQAYVDGKRQRYTPPMRLILTCFSLGVVILLASTRVTVDELSTGAVVEDGAFLMVDEAGRQQRLAFELEPDSAIGKKLAVLEEQTDPAYATRKVLQVALRSTSLSAMLLIPVLAGLLRLANPRTLLVQHLLFSALAHGAVFLLFVLGSLVSSRVGSAAVLLLPVYVARHQWSLAPGQHAWNGLKTSVMLAVHLVASWFAFLVALMVGLYRL